MLFRFRRNIRLAPASGWSHSSWLYRQFPHAPRSVRELYPRLAGLAFVTGAILLDTIPKHHILLLEGLWFQLCAAALLWWEANASSMRMQVVVADLRQPFQPTTLAEKATHWLSATSGWLILLLAYAVVALALVAKDKLQHLMQSELEWAVAFLALAAVVYLVGRLVDRSLVNLRKSMMTPGQADEEEIKVRRYLRTAAFVLLFVGTLGQMVETLFLK